MSLIRLSNTKPSADDTLVTNQRKMLQILDDAASGMTPLPVDVGGGYTARIPHFAAVGADDDAEIPSGALSWSAILLSGTGTIDGVSLPVGLPLSGGKIETAIPVTTSASSTMFLAWETSA